MTNNLCSWLLLFITLIACNTRQEPYFKYKLAKAAKAGKGCTAYSPKFSMVSNIVGERYQFQKCLHTDSQHTIERRGDTVVVNFTGAAKPETLYEITMDIDTYPQYHFLTLDGTTFTIIPTN